MKGVIHDLINDGNSVIVVDHDIEILKESDHIIEMGPKAGVDGGYVIARGTISDIEKNKDSIIGGFLSGKEKVIVRSRSKKEDIFENGKIHLSTGCIHTVKPLEIDIPKGKLTVVTGVSGSGKTTMVLESLVPAIENMILEKKLPEHILNVEAKEIKQIKLIDATPIGINVRSTVATYANIHDELRKIYAKTKNAKELKYKAGDFSYNTGKLRCPHCDGTGTISLDVQFLPDVEIPCPECRGSRYSKDAYAVKYNSYSMPELMAMNVNKAAEICKEAQRLKLASEMRKAQNGSIFVFDEPTIGLHPLDVRTLLCVFQTLIENGATVIVIEHDLDVIKNADYIIDMGPDGGEKGGEIIFKGTFEELKKCKISKTAKFL